jgi:hypothetical protein
MVSCSALKQIPVLRRNRRLSAHPLPEDTSPLERIEARRGVILNAPLQQYLTDQGHLLYGDDGYRMTCGDLNPAPVEGQAAGREFST